MRTVIGAVGAAIIASACCLGPVALAMLGAGVLGAAAVKLEPYRPWFLGLTGVLLAAGFYSTYRPSREACAPDGSCRPSSKRAAKIMLWIAAILVALLAAFPYYVNFLI